MGESIMNLNDLQEGRGANLISTFKTMKCKKGKYSFFNRGLIAPHECHEDEEGQASFEALSHVWKVLNTFSSVVNR